MRLVATGILAALALVASHASAPEPTAARDAVPLPRVTVIGDSVATALGQQPAARQLLASGVDLRLELAVCRRLAGESCPYEGVRPPTVLQLVAALGRELGRTVIVAVGYNDDEELYARNIEETFVALRHAGVERVLWATLRAARHPYLTMNQAIEEAASRHPELAVVDWNLYSRSHPEWFQPDGLHLGYGGAVAMATLFHAQLVKLGIPVRPEPAALRVATKRLPAAFAGARYGARLAAVGGRPPYRWLRGTPFPRWLRLTAAGRLVGIAEARPGRLAVAVRLTDAAGASVTRRLILRVRG
jgi:hypothetical protein